jgi:ABC-type uncharacterized transport system involved in gliding motility auxiliary subunit
VDRTWQIAGLAGLVLTLFGLIAFLATGDILDLYVLLHLGLGLACLAVYVFTQGRTLLGSLRSRSTSLGVGSLVYSLLVLAFLILLNFLNARYHHRWDLTETGVYSLSPQSAKILTQLAQDLEIYGFFERGENPKVADLVKSYAYQSPRVKFQSVDPDRHPEMAKTFKIQQLNTLHIRYGRESTNVTESTEEAITNAIIKLTKATKKNVYFLTGHGEPRIDARERTQGYAAAKEALENENYQVKEILLSAQEKVPDDASLLIIAAPQKPLLEHELREIGEYIRRGGRALVLLPTTGGDGLKSFLKEWSVEVGDDIVVDQVVRLFAGPTLGVEPIVENYNVSHPVTRDFKERTLFPMVRSVEAARSARDGLEVISLVQTSATSWAEKDVDAVFKQGKASLGGEDKKGPVSVGVAVSANLKKIGSDRAGDVKMIVLGTADFANNRYLNIFFNRDFFVNGANWLVGQEELISIRPRSVRSSRVQFTESEGKAVFYLSFLFLPEVLLIIGLAVWWRRR